MLSPAKPANRITAESPGNCIRASIVNRGSTVFPTGRSVSWTIAFTGPDRVRMVHFEFGRELNSAVFAPQTSEPRLPVSQACGPSRDRPLAPNPIGTPSRCADMSLASKLLRQCHSYARPANRWCLLRLPDNRPSDDLVVGARRHGARHHDEPRGGKDRLTNQER
jgi:hypothetical protein